jgi:L-threonylcarbamoyladenylate synthase
LHTSVLVVDPLHPDPDVIARAAEVLRGRGLVAFPTETVYGLGAHALDADAVRRIFVAKGRPANNPIIVHVADPQQVHDLAAAWPDAAARLAERFWPGPLTLVLPKRETVPDIVTAGGPTVAIRLPAHPVALALLRACGLPIAAPSANRSTELSPTLARHVLRGLDGLIDTVLDGGPTQGGLESTVVDVSVSPARLLRPGLVTPAEIEAIVGPIEQVVKSVGTETAPSPGMLSRHYAPRTPLEVGEGSERVRRLAEAGERVAWLVCEEREEMAGVRIVRMPVDAVEYAAALYATLHALDEEGFDRIIVESLPEDGEWLAIRDRLRRASG